MMDIKRYTYGDPEAGTWLLQMVDDHDLEVIERETAFISELTDGQSFCLTAVKVNNWNDDLSPWPAAPVFGKEGFGGGAAETLKYLLEEVLSGQAGGRDTREEDRKRIYIGGYSLAGLFALWAGYQTDLFRGIAAASPSVWFEGFTGYMRDHAIRTEAVYLSLGDREERTRNPVMAQVGHAIRSAHDILEEDGKKCMLEWNKGNHFREPDLRTAKAFAWLMNGCVIK